MSQRPISEPALIRALVRHDDHVILCGVQDSPHDDPSALAVCQRLKAELGGRATLLDAQFKPHASRQDLEKTEEFQEWVARGYTPKELHQMHRNANGSGDPYAHKAELLRLAKNLKLEVVEPRVHIADLMNVKIRPDPADVLIVRGSAAYALWNVAREPLMPQNKEMEARVHQLANEMNGLVHPAKTIAIWYPTHHGPMAAKLAEAFRELGGNTQSRRLKPAKTEAPYRFGKHEFNGHFRYDHVLIVRTRA